MQMPVGDLQCFHLVLTAHSQSLKQLTLPEKLSMAAPQKVEATAMQMPFGEPAMLPSQIDSTTPSVRMTRESTSNPVGTCMCRAVCVRPCLSKPQEVQPGVACPAAQVARCALAAAPAIEPGPCLQLQQMPALRTLALQ